MSFHVQQREREGIVLLDCKGKLVVGEPVQTLREQLRNLAAENKVNVILNLEQVDYIDSSGLGAMVMDHNLLQNAGGGMKLLHLNKRAIELLVLTKLTTVFDSFSDEQAALDSFFPDRETKKFDILSFVKEQREEQV